MTKKLSKSFKRITSIALAMMLFVSMALPGMAAGGHVVIGTPDKPAEAKITKLFKMPIGTETPNYEFIFNIEPKEVDDDPYDAVEENMPIILGGSTKIQFTVADTGDVTDGVKLAWRESASLFAGAAWKHAGIYLYEITEEHDNNDLTKSDPKMLDDELEYSVGKYSLELHVVEKPDKTGFYVKYIVARIVDADNEEQKEGEKINPEPGGGDDDDYSQMVFTNIFVRNYGTDEPGDPEDPEIVDKYTVFQVSKTVSGDLGDKTKEFSFNVIIDKAKIGVPASRPYTAYKMEKDANGKSVILDELTFADHAGQDIKLTHGQWLAFIDMPVGTYYSVNEAGTLKYTPSYIQTYAGVAGSAVHGAENGALGLDDQYIGKLTNGMAFDNEYESTTPTGISVDNLPYVVMIAAAMLALIGMTVFKYRGGLKSRA